MAREYARDEKRATPRRSRNEATVLLSPVTLSSDDTEYSDQSKIITCLSLEVAWIHNHFN